MDDIERMHELVREDFKRRILEHDPLLTDREIEKLISEAIKEPLQS